MSIIPSIATAPCPNCKKTPHLKFKHFFSNLVQLRCECGVAGHWVQTDSSHNPWNAASFGWEKVAGEPKAVEAPPPRGRSEIKVIASHLPMRIDIDVEGDIFTKPEKQT